MTVIPLRSGRGHDPGYVAIRTRPLEVSASGVLGNLTAPHVPVSSNQLCEHLAHVSLFWKMIGSPRSHGNRNREGCRPVSKLDGDGRRANPSSACRRWHRPEALCSLVELVPMAYCRVLLADMGTRFPETFQRYRGDGTTTPARPLASEPVWVAAMDFAKREIESGLSRNDKLRVAGRSAEFRAANELLYKGSKLEDLGFTPPVFMWPEEGPDSDPPVPRKPWWRVWR